RAGPAERGPPRRARAVRLRVRPVLLSGDRTALLAAVRGRLPPPPGRVPPRPRRQGPPHLGAVQRRPGLAKPAAAVGLVLPGRGGGVRAGRPRDAAGAKRVAGGNTLRVRGRVIVES